ncbi:MAG: amidohydrolase [Candidatus Electronema sp. V4]|uniref:amidohydrolase n=1 Tax=Candidatus Electronema sp. V4 TaxID=3454756 RepID=UPI004055394C
MRHDVHLILAGRWLVSMDGAAREEAGISVAVAGDSIAEIGPNLAAKYPQAELLSCPYGLIMPGLVNVHTHAAMSCFRGLADDLPLMDWLTRHIFPREARLTKEIVYHATLLSLCEMIKSGTTSFNDMYLFNKEAARAAAKAGMRAWIGEGFFDFPSPNYGELENGFAYAEELFSAYKSSELISITVNPHAVYTCSPSLLQRAAALAERKKALFHIHLAETRDEVKGCVERYGCTPARHLERLGLLNERVVAAHCVMLDDEEIELLAQRGIKIAHCPESNMKLACGIAPVQKMLNSGLSVGIGTDGSASNNDIDMFGEMSTAAKLHKVRDLDPTAMSAETVLRAATLGGAAVLGAADKIGSLAVGKKADMIMLDMRQPHLCPLHNPASQLVYAAKGSDVLHSVINGRVVMRDRRLTRLDEAAILTEMENIGEAVRRSAEHACS